MRRNTPAPGAAGPDGVTAAIRGPVLTYTGDPFQLGLRRTLVYEPDAIVAMANGSVTHFGPASKLRPLLPRRTPIETYGRHSLIMAGFVDCHVHYPQTRIVGAYGAQLSTGSRSTRMSPSRRSPTTATHGRRRGCISTENLRNGITTAAVFCTVHPQSVDALFSEAAKLDLRLIAGKVLMDRNAPARATGHGAAGLRRVEGADPAVARPRARALRDHAAFRPGQHARADRSDGRAVARVARRLPAIARRREPPRGRVGEGALSRMQKLPRRLRSLRPPRPARDLRPRHLAHRSGACALPRVGHRDRTLPDIEFLSRQRLSGSRPDRAQRPPGKSRSRDRCRRRHLVLDPADHGRSLQGGAGEPATRSRRGTPTISRPAGRRTRSTWMTGSAALHRGWRRISSSSISRRRRSSSTG